MEDHYITEHQTQFKTHVWTVDNAKVRNKTNRFFGSTNLKYDINDDINVVYRYGIDTFFEAQEYGQNKGGVDGNRLGMYRTINVNNTIIDHNVSVNYKERIYRFTRFNSGCWFQLKLC